MTAAEDVAAAAVGEASGRRVPAVALRHRWRLTLAACGPALVAAVAYVDPGNVATNVTAGSRYRYRLVWVVVLATAGAGLIQFLAAKLGVVTGRSLPELCRERLRPAARVMLWLQAECVAVATDVAEVIGGAIALYLLFDLPIAVGAGVTGIVSTAALVVQSRGGQRRFETVMVGMLVLVLVGFSIGTVAAVPSWSGIAAGLLPGFPDRDAVPLAAGIVGATIMPHAIYAHTALVRDRFGRTVTAAQRARLVVAARVDVLVAMVVAGLVNAALLLGAAGVGGGLATIEGIHAAYRDRFGPLVALLFAGGLLVSGLASSAVGTYAGSVILDGFLGRRIPVGLRRVVTLVPAIGIVAAAGDLVHALVLSQVVLSIGIPFAVLPLVLFTADRRLMGAFRNRWTTTALAAAVGALVAWLALVVIVGPLW